MLISLQAIGVFFSALGVVGVVLTAWINARISIARLQERCAMLEEKLNIESSENSVEFKNISENFKEMFRSLSEIKVAMEKKEDRK